MRLRIALGACGVLLALFGAFRLVTQVSAGDLFMLVVWLGGALVLHDGVLAPIVAGVGAALDRWVPPRARAFLQGGLLGGGLITAVAVPLILRQNSQAPSKALLRRDYGGNLTVLLAAVTAVTLLAYGVRLVRDHRRPTR